MAGCGVPINPYANIVQPQQLPNITPVAPPDVTAGPAAPQGLLSGFTGSDPVVGPALSRMGNTWLQGLRSMIGTDGATTSVPKVDNKPAPVAAAPAIPANAIYEDELPKLKIGHLKALAPFLSKEASPPDPMKQMYLKNVDELYEMEKAAAGTDRKKQIDALANRMTRMSSVVAPSAAPGVNAGVGITPVD